MDINVWLKGKSTLYVGGDPTKGTPPIITVSLNQPQVVVDEAKGTITILETIGNKK